jgi:hypothetical protein
VKPSGASHSIQKKSMASPHIFADHFPGRTKPNIAEEYIGIAMQDNTRRDRTGRAENKNSQDKHRQVRAGQVQSSQVRSSQVRSGQLQICAKLPTGI